MDCIYRDLADALFGPDANGADGLPLLPVRAFVKALVQARWESQTKSFLKLHAVAIQDSADLEAELNG